MSETVTKEQFQKLVAYTKELARQHNELEEPVERLVTDYKDFKSKAIVSIEELEAFAAKLGTDLSKVARLEEHACQCVLDPEDGSTMEACPLHPQGGSPRQRRWAKGASE